MSEPVARLSRLESGSHNYFDYEAAFVRNIGWVTPHEQEALRSKRVAIAGLGGVGGSHLLTLTRLGIGRFNVADPDRFELANFNRQAGASLKYVGRSKVDVMAELASDINPELSIRKFSEGVDRNNLDKFLADVDLYVDGLDFFAVATRRAVFARCAAAGIPAVTAAPLGMGAAVLNFLPGSMTFEEYFQLQGHNEEEQLLRFLLGLSPAMLQMGYLVHPAAVDLAAHRGPSTAMACETCAGMAATEALKILLGRGKVLAAPRGLQFDAYRNRLVRTWRPGGNRNPLQRLGLAIARRQLSRTRTNAVSRIHVREDLSPMEQILDMARWAPSGDNTQPWRFELKGGLEVVIHGHDTRDHCVYDLKGHASQIALGALLENIGIAATRHGLRAEIAVRIDQPETHPTFNVRCVPDSAIKPDPLYPYIPVRATQRRPMSTRPLANREKSALESAAGSSYSVYWLEGLSNRLKVAKLLYLNAGLRLTLPEAYQVHSSVIEWNARFSEDRIPDLAVGLDPLTTRITRWAFSDWTRLRFLNTYLGGTVLPRIELDVMPSLSCAAHFLIVGTTPPRTVDDYVAAGRAVQRVWLTAMSLGLWQQPEVTPLIFSGYVREEVQFTKDSQSYRLAERVAANLGNVVPAETVPSAVWMGRIGAGPAPTARSVRLPLERLIVS